MSKYTAGPWSVKRGFNFIQVLPVTGSILPVAEAIDLRRKEHAEALANAHLIAAAPEMLEALLNAEAMLEIFLSDRRESDARLADRDGYGEDYVSGHTQNVEADLKAVRNAIAKARGESC